MWRSGSTRVACLWIPRFPIVVALQGATEPDRPAALIRGEGSHGRLIQVNPAAEAAGLFAGARLARARALAPESRWIRWDEGLDQVLGQRTRGLSRALAEVTPRLDVVAPGCFWLEPFVARDAPSLAVGEADFAGRVRDVVAQEGFPMSRVGVADGAITAHAAARYGSARGVRVPPGKEAEFLGSLPCAALPVGPRTLALLEGVGVTDVASLQRIDASALIARFGREGERLYALARGRDARGPRSPPVEEPTRVHVPLASPCLSIEPLLFVLRAALDRLVASQVARGNAVSRVRLTLHQEGGEELSIEISPGRPTTRSRLLLELLRLALTERSKTEEAALSMGTEALTIEVVERATASPRQRDLFVERVTDPAALERVLLRLTHRLGARAVGRPERVETRHPDRQGRWRSTDGPRPELQGMVVGPEATRAPLAEGEVRPTHHAPACYRRLDVPVPVGLPDPDRLDLSSMDEGVVSVRAWHGAERQAGAWWSAPYDRVYRWAELEDGRLYRLYRCRAVGAWFLEGWLD